MKTLVYADKGVSHLSLQETLRTFTELNYPVKTICHKTLLNTPWEKETSLLIIPGGRDIPYHHYLKGKGNKKIRQFVENGGHFLGICAGAYFASEEVIFEKGSLIEVHEKRELQFFPGAAVGTIYSHVTFTYGSEKGSHAAKIACGENALHLYYNGGCTFHQAKNFPSVTILATYADANSQPAVIHSRVGKGSAILSGIHFEVGAKALKKEGCHTGIIQKLEDSNENRKAFISYILNCL